MAALMPERTRNPRARRSFQRAAIMDDRKNLESAAMDGRVDAGAAAQSMCSPQLPAGSDQGRSQ
jgi:hypothetical protein